MPYLFAQNYLNDLRFQVNFIDRVHAKITTSLAIFSLFSMAEKKENVYRTSLP